ncbi:hypothetical protein Q3O97_03230 [Ralstonia pseudosolanacearum]|uniref:hypothetical protein n=1 Tax=Ralstonia pseudosolanacearum TaxID=1310165 RepID=UPI0027005807|nr:hypothetical protein [Ralstonia pseudosolanacearum]MDO3614857.1 hypothetical protein [Ralstonia pseudosolanacearum]
MKTSIAFNIDTNSLQGCTDDYLAALWHIAQINPAWNESHDAGVLVEHIGREIIRRWMRGVPVPLWNIQGGDYYHQQLIRFAQWNGIDWEAMPAGSLIDVQQAVPESL